MGGDLKIKGFWNVKTMEATLAETFGGAGDSIWIKKD